MVIFTKVWNILFHCCHGTPNGNQLVDRTFIRRTTRQSLAPLLEAVYGLLINKGVVQEMLPEAYSPRYLGSFDVPYHPARRQDVIDVVQLHPSITASILRGQM